MEFTAAGLTFRVRKPCAREQFLLLRRLLPLMPALRSIGLREAGALGILAAVDSVPEADLAQCIESAFALCECQIDGVWSSATRCAAGRGGHESADRGRKGVGRQTSR